MTNPKRRESEEVFVRLVESLAEKREDFGKASVQSERFVFQDFSPKAFCEAFKELNFARVSASWENFFFQLLE